MRILNLHNTILVSLLVAGAAASAACSSSDAARPDGGAGTGAGGTSSGATGGTAAGATAGANTGGSTPVAGSSSGGSSNPTGGTGGGATGPSVCDGTASRVLMNTPADAFIDDFETIAMGATDATLAGPAWYAFSDLGPAGVDATDSMFKILRTAGMGAASTAFFGEYKGTAANIPPTPMAFGVGVEINVGVNPSIMQYCVDASAFTGVSFWAKVGSSANATVIADFVVPSQNKASPASIAAGAPDADCTGTCYNFPQKSFTFTTEWQRYSLDFAGLKGATGATVVGNKIQQVEWLPQSKDWDLSLDEIAFYNGTPPAGAVAPPAGAGGSGSGGSGGSN